MYSCLPLTLRISLLYADFVVMTTLNSCNMAGQSVLITSLTLRIVYCLRGDEFDLNLFDALGVHVRVVLFNGLDLFTDAPKVHSHFYALPVLVFLGDSFPIELNLLQLCLIDRLLR